MPAFIDFMVLHHFTRPSASSILPVLATDNISAFRGLKPDKCAVVVVHSHLFSPSHSIEDDFEIFTPSFSDMMETRTPDNFRQLAVNDSQEATLRQPLRGFIVPPQMMEPFMAYGQGQTAIVDLFLNVTRQIHSLVMQDVLPLISAKEQYFHMLQQLWALSFPNHRGLRPQTTQECPVQTNILALRYAQIIHNTYLAPPGASIPADPMVTQDAQNTPTEENVMRTGLPPPPTNPPQPPLTDNTLTLHSILAKIIALQAETKSSLALKKERQNGWSAKISPYSKNMLLYSAVDFSDGCPVLPTEPNEFYVSLLTGPKSMARMHLQNFLTNNDTFSCDLAVTPHLAAILYSADLINTEKSNPQTFSIFFCALRDVAQPYTELPDLVWDFHMACQSPTPEMQKQATAPTPAIANHIYGLILQAKNYQMIWTIISSEKGASLRTWPLLLLI